MNTNKLILLFGIVLTIGVVRGQEGYSCDSPADKDTHEVVKEEVLWRNITEQCTTKVRLQIKKEIDASNKYLQLGAYFSRETINRPGFAHFFFEAAKEEREHASKLIGYLLMRGRLTDNITESDDMAPIFSFPSEYTLDINEAKSYSGLAALKKAQKMETSVTESIKDVIAACEKEKKGDKEINDYHLVDYLITEFLTEQYEGQRQLAGYISTLSKLMGTNKEIGEFLFDKQLL